MIKVFAKSLQASFFLDYEGILDYKLRNVKVSLMKPKIGRLGDFLMAASVFLL